MAIDLDKAVVDQVVAYVDRVQEADCVKSDKASWDDLYGYMFKKLGVEDNAQNRKLFNVGFGVATVTEMRHSGTDPMARMLFGNGIPAA